jgi:2-polyprenyl-3-methyl-5-hydroxy-6-metoxy-1,4-benzoquinol methylase
MVFQNFYQSSLKKLPNIQTVKENKNMDFNNSEQILKINNESYERISSSFSASRNRPWPDVDYALKKYLKDGSRVLDIGCGNGRLVHSLFKSKNIDYLGFDNSKSLIEQAKKIKESKKEKLSKNKIKIKFETRDMLDLADEPAENYDLIFLISSLNHIPSLELQQKILVNINRMLKKDGLLIMTNWNMWQVNRKNKKSVWYYKFNHNFQLPYTKNNLGFKEIITLWQNKHPLFYQAFTLKDLKKLLTFSGFKTLENKYVRQDKKVHWWNGHNILTIARKK